MTALPLPCPCGFGKPGDVIWEGAEHDTACPWYTSGPTGPEIQVAPLPTIHIAVWEGDTGGPEAQAYTTQEAALRDFEGAASFIESTIQS